MKRSTITLKSRRTGVDLRDVVGPLSPDGARLLRANVTRSAKREAERKAADASKAHMTPDEFDQLCAGLQAKYDDDHAAAMKRTVDPESKQEMRDEKRGFHIAIEEMKRAVRKTVVGSGQRCRDGVLMKDKAKQRPADFATLSPKRQWAIDKALGILDWDGT